MRARCVSVPIPTGVVGAVTRIGCVVPYDVAVITMKQKPRSLAYRAAVPACVGSDSSTLKSPAMGVGPKLPGSADKGVLAV